MSVSRLIIPLSKLVSINYRLGWCFYATFKSSLATCVLNLEVDWYTRNAPQTYLNTKSASHHLYIMSCRCTWPHNYSGDKVFLVADTSVLLASFFSFGPKLVFSSNSPSHFNDKTSYYFCDLLLIVVAFFLIMSNTFFRYNSPTPSPSGTQGSIPFSPPYPISAWLPTRTPDPANINIHWGFLPLWHILRCWYLYTVPIQYLLNSVYLLKAERSSFIVLVRLYSSFYLAYFVIV